MNRAMVIEPAELAPHASLSSTDQPDALRLTGLHKQFGSFIALADINLTVRKGEFVCLLGPSGCGKTTLLRMIAGLENANAGQIDMLGVDVTRQPAAKRNYGIVFQSYALFPNLNVAENIAYGLKGRRQDKQSRVSELLTLIGLTGIESKYPGQLSGGQQQRVALARALATSPGLLLLDEPLSALDARVREHLRREIRSLQQRLGITTIMVTHDQEEALTMADRIVVMNQGHIEQIGTPDEIYAMPQSRFVAEFVGRANWLGGKVDGHGVVRVGDTQLAVPHLPPLPLGREIELFVRPEAVALHARWQGGQNMVLAHMVGVESLGGFCRVSLVVPAMGNLAMIADVSRTELATLNLQSGQMVPVTLPQAGLRFFLDEVNAGVVA
ncbi:MULTISPECIES: putative 2-aminoethylphosphonate ABC transporter ATP-binding protein [Silvimonas]|uniref:putative 2-aminoethylphosphonate ABC transporter ATP-binding protein n=1 Tax=Silvimonas TaxID=300264 RepID=UPI0024B34495|nr:MULTISPECIES: putative 2-aminoethylphosphonate ABC transporter ATP-binding protein [Silvimonas]MDR3426352.1 putative 2-aminoethylphosphonate ABC transporter ATP-binding protein [Silvimonas sp.]